MLLRQGIKGKHEAKWAIPLSVTLWHQRMLKSRLVNFCILVRLFEAEIRPASVNAE